MAADKRRSSFSSFVRSLNSCTRFPNLVALHGSSKPGKRNFGRFSRPLLEVYFQTSFRYDQKVKSLAVAEIFRYCEGFRRSYSYFCLLDQKYKRGLVRTLLTPDSCCIAGATWTTAKIGDLGSFTKGAPLSKADIEPDGTPFILYGELYTTYHEVINAVIRRTQAQPEKQYYSRVGDVIIPTSGETPEEISTAACVMLPDIILAGDLNIFRSSKIDGRIMSYILNHIVSGQIARIAQGKSVVHIQANELSKIEISYPDYNTQRKMIKIFDALNARTEIAQKKLMALRCMQKALLQQLFI